MAGDVLMFELAEPTWAVERINGEVLAWLYHKDNALVEARALARRHCEKLRVVELVSSTRRLAAIIDPARRSA